MPRDVRWDPRISRDAVEHVADLIGAPYLKRFIQADGRTLRIDGSAVAEALDLPARVVPYVDGYHLAMDDLDDLLGRMRRLGFDTSVVIAEADEEADLITVEW